MQLSQLQTNIRLLVAHAMLREFNVLIPVILPFLLLRDVTFAQFMAVQGAFMMSMLLADPLISPLADKYGRKPMILAGSLFWILGHVIIWLSHSWLSYAFAEALLGIGMAAYRPATKALLYDGFVTFNRTAQHYKTLTRLSTWQSAASAISMVLGGVLFTINPNFVAGITVFSTLGLIALSWKLTEAPVHTKLGDNVTSIPALISAAWKTLTAPNTRWIVALPAFISGTTIVLFWSFQQVSRDAGLSVLAISMLLALHSGFRAVFAWKCPTLVERLNVKACFTLCTVLVAVGVFSMALLPWWASFVPFTLAAGLAFILADTMGEELINRHTASEVRSTTLGAYSVVGRFISLCTLTGCGLLQEVVGLPLALLVVGAITVSLASISLSRLPRTTAEPSLKAAA